MDKIEILIVGTNKPIVEVIAKLIRQNDQWEPTTAHTLNDAKANCKAKEYKFILIGGGITDFEIDNLQQHIIKIGSKIPIVKHYGGGSGLLFTEIYEALKT